MNIVLNDIEYNAITDINELTLDKFTRLEPLIIQDVNFLNKNEIYVKIAEIICGVEEDYFFHNLPLDELPKLESLVDSIKSTELKMQWPVTREYDGQTFIFKQKNDGFKTGEFMSLQILLMDENLSTVDRSLYMMAYMVRPGEFKNGIWIQDNLNLNHSLIENRVEIFRKYMKYVDAQQLISFFLNTVTEYLSNMKSSMEDQTSSPKSHLKRTSTTKGRKKKQI